MQGRVDTSFANKPTYGAVFVASSIGPSFRPILFRKSEHPNLVHNQAVTLSSYVWNNNVFPINIKPITLSSPETQHTFHFDTLLPPPIYDFVGKCPHPPTVEIGGPLPTSRLTTIPDFVNVCPLNHEAFIAEPSIGSYSCLSDVPSLKSHSHILYNPQSISDGRWVSLLRHELSSQPSHIETITLIFPASTLTTSDNTYDINPIGPLQNSFITRHISSVHISNPLSLGQYNNSRAEFTFPSHPKDLYPLLIVRLDLTASLPLQLPPIFSLPTPEYLPLHHSPDCPSTIALSKPPTNALIFTIPSALRTTISKLKDNLTKSSLFPTPLPHLGPKHHSTFITYTTSPTLTETLTNSIHSIAQDRTHAASLSILTNSDNNFNLHFTIHYSVSFVERFTKLSGFFPLTDKVLRVSSTLDTLHSIADKITKINNIILSQNKTPIITHVSAGTHTIEVVPIELTHRAPPNPDNPLSSQLEAAITGPGIKLGLLTQPEDISQLAAKFGLNSDPSSPGGPRWMIDPDSGECALVANIIDPSSQSPTWIPLRLPGCSYAELSRYTKRFSSKGPPVSSFPPSTSVASISASLRELRLQPNPKFKPYKPRKDIFDAIPEDLLPTPPPTMIPQPTAPPASGAPLTLPPHPQT